MLVTKTVVRLTIIAVLTANLVCLFAEGRTEFRRLLYSNSNEYGISGSSQQNRQYYYRLDSPSLVESVSQMRSSDYSGPVWTTFVYNSNIQYVDAGVKYEYYVVSVDPPIPSHHVYFILDEQGRSVKTCTEHWNTQFESYWGTRTLFRHYNLAGYADSLHYIDHAGTPYYTKRFFENSMLQSSVTYYYVDGNWNPDQRFIFTYSENPVELSSHVRFDNLDNQVSMIMTYDFELFANSKFLPETISSQLWNPSSASWQTDTYYIYSQTLENNRVKLQVSHDSGNTSESDMLIIDMDGNIVQSGSYWDYGLDGGGSTTNYVWDSVVDNSDEIAPEITSSLRSYPNPFNSELVISLNSKDTTLANLSIYNIKGQLIRKWQNIRAGEFIWDGKDSASNPVSRGIYLIKLQQGIQTCVTKVIRF